jgi:hypothetical protein
MPAVNAKDSRGHSHYMISQEDASACGPVCMAMVEAYYKMRCTKADLEKRFKDLSGQLPDGWKAGQGADWTSLSTTLSAIGVKNAAVTTTPSQIFDTLKAGVTERTPAIVLVKHLGKAGLFHVVVCRIVYPDDLAVFVDPDFDFIDPKQGLIEVNKRNLPTYKFDESGKWTFDGRVITTSL